MNHPSREQWMAYLYGELGESAKADLDAHLHTCPDCKQAMNGWRATMVSLDSWSVPTRRRTYGVQAPALKWAAAALVAAGIGFGFGRVSAPRLNAETLRAEVRQQVGEDLAAALAAKEETRLTAEQAKLRAGLENWTIKTAAAANAGTQQTLSDFIDWYKTARATDKEEVLTMLRRFRVDLETVALEADTRINRAQSQIGQLAAYTQGEANLSPANFTPVRNPNQKGN